MAKQWFGVKSVYLLTADGKPKTKDASYKNVTSMVEERVVLISAKDFEHALNLGQKEAKEYASASFENPYGQTVSMKVLGLDAFLLSDKIGDHAEIFSSTELLEEKISPKAILNHRLGRDPGKNDVKLRRKFSDGSLDSES